MQWLLLVLPVLVGFLLIKWLTTYKAQKIESNVARESRPHKMRLEPSARLPEVITPSSRYQARAFILSKVEQVFYRCLEEALDQQFLILIKVRVADVLQPEHGLTKSVWQIAYNQISAKHFDFVICDQTSFEIIAAIELDDRSHQRENRKRHDKILNAACESANFPLLRISARNSYSTKEIKTIVLGSIRDYGLRKAA